MDGTWKWKIFYFIYLCLLMISYQQIHYDTNDLLMMRIGLVNQESILVDLNDGEEFGPFEATLFIGGAPEYVIYFIIYKLLYTRFY